MISSKYKNNVLGEEEFTFNSLFYQYWAAYVTGMFYESYKVCSESPWQV